MQLLMLLLLLLHAVTAVTAVALVLIVDAVNAVATLLLSQWLMLRSLSFYLFLSYYLSVSCHSLFLYGGKNKETLD